MTACIAAPTAACTASARLEGSRLAASAAAAEGDAAFAEVAVSPADFNHDGVVNGADLGLLIGAWGLCEGCPEDINEDGLVNGADLGLLFGVA